MADNVAITPGTGATIAADDIGGVHYQRVKLALGADGTANDASAGAGAVGTGTQRVTLASDDPVVSALATANAHLANIETSSGDTTTPVPVIGYLGAISVTPTVEATPDYSTGDVIGGKNLIAAITRADGKTGYITSVRIYCKVDNTVQIDCLFFNADPSATTWTENGTVAMSDTDASKLLGVAKVTDWTDLGTPVVGFKECRIPITGNAADDIYMVMVARGTINLGSTSDLIVQITVDQN